MSNISELFAQQNRLRQWVARSNGPGKRSWFVYNEATRDYHYSLVGDLIRYSFEGAVKAAEGLNSGPTKEWDATGAIEGLG